MRDISSKLGQKLLQNVWESIISDPFYYLNKDIAHKQLDFPKMQHLVQYIENIADKHC
ncbi:MAG: hypothetical protein WC860_09605 [Candidatus Margulisiibacteriota bacterium]|jgi:hypothetical protein